jgi:hypothetical protein
LKRQLVRSEVRIAIEKILAAGKTVVTVAGTPASAFDVPKRLLREVFWFGRPRLTIERSTVSAEYDWIESMFADFASQKGFRVVSLLRELCDERNCQVFDPRIGRPIFTDDDHFDPEWILAHGNVFTPLVQPSSAR